jgi:hypothetical protein
MKWKKIASKNQTTTSPTDRLIELRDSKRLLYQNFWPTVLLSIGGHRHRSQCRRYPTSDIDIFYSDIGDKYVGLKNVIPTSTSELIPISDIKEKKALFDTYSNPHP